MAVFVSTYYKLSICLCLSKMKFYISFQYPPKTNQCHTTNPNGLIGTKMQGDGFTGRKLHIALKNLAKRIRL
jgi:hypothetical protein